MSTWDFSFKVNYINITNCFNYIFISIFIYCNRESNLLVIIMPKKKNDTWELPKKLMNSYLSRNYSVFLSFIIIINNSNSQIHPISELACIKIIKKKKIVEGLCSCKPKPKPKPKPELLILCTIEIYLSFLIS